MSDSDKGLRFNTGKSRHDLFEPFAIDEVAKVFTKGALKYSDDNWKKGMEWKKMLASLKRHINQFEQGEDFDFDDNCPQCKEGTCVNHTGLYHIAHAAWNCLALLSYYKIYPQGDNRQHNYLKRPKIGLDIDEVICDWVGAWAKHFNMSVPSSWFFDRNITDKFDALRDSGELDNFYLNLQPRILPSEIPFEPHCYVTSRPVDTNVTEKWLDMHGFPARPVITVPVGTSKVQVLKESGVEIFVDDRYDNFVELNNAGICTFLMDAPHNARYNVGYKRIKSLKELL